jgi:elongation factor G
VKAYASADIRNLAVAGHSHAGKTQLISALLYTAGATPKMTTVAEGNTVTDYDEEEMARQMTISMATAHLEWGGKCKVNLIDSPGFNMYIHEAKAAMVPAEAAMIVVDGANGVEVMTERVWQYAEEFEIPRLVVVSRMDRDRADSDRVIASLRETFGRNLIPVNLPIGNEKGLKGVVDVLRMKAYQYEMGGNGKGKEIPIPADLQDLAKRTHEEIVELVAEGNDELMSEFFEKGTIPDDHLVAGLREAIVAHKIFPIMFSSALGNVGTEWILNFICEFAPAPEERAPVHDTPLAAGEPSEHHVTDSESLTLQVFKTTNDAFAGRITFFKVFSGVLKNDAAVQNYTRTSAEKFSHLSIMQGKNAIPVTELHAGDIGAVAKLKNTLTGDTLGDKAHPVAYATVTFPEPAITFAIEPKTRADEDKLANGIHKLMEEDQMLRFFRDDQTKEFLIAGTGQQHIEVTVSKLKKRFNTEVNLKAPKVPYRETIRGRADVQGRHKKQSGGHGQYGDCKIKMEPMPRGGGFVFENDIFGGAIPKNYIPAVEKGIVEAAARGYLAGFPVVDFKVILYDGSYHDVDSNELSFKTAGRIAFKKAMEQAKPVLLEPVMNLEITVPDEFAGAIMGDLNSRRGRIQGMENKGHNTIVKAEVPMAEVLTYGVELTSMTQARGSFHMEMSHYDVVPGQLQEKIVAAARAERGELVEVEE